VCGEHSLERAQQLAEDQSTATGNAKRSLALLTLTYVFSYADRYTMAILAQPIKVDLRLSDTQVGLLTGFAFSALYALAALPLGRLADRTNRIRLLAYSLAIWSVLTGLCSLTRNFTELALARMGIGIGEAGCVPSAHSLISDLYHPRRRALALAVFTCGGMAGMLGAFAIGGRLEHVLGWRTTFVAIALPGFLLSLALPVVLSEPRARVNGLTEGANFVPLGQLWRIPGFIALLAGYGFLVFNTLGITQWLPAFYERSFGLTRVTIGGMLALGQGIGSILGLLVGGFVSDRGGRLHSKWPPAQMILAVALALPAQMASFVVRDVALSMSLGFIAILVAMMGMAPAFALVQNITPPRARATAAAMSLAMAAIIGSGGGPLAAGAISDLLHETQGDASLRLALVTAGGFGGITAVILLIAAMQRLRIPDTALSEA
jgi:MFS family permease